MGFGPPSSAGMGGVPEVSLQGDRGELHFDSEHHSLDLPLTHSPPQSCKPAYRGTGPPGHRVLPRAGRPGPGWRRRRGVGRRAPPAAVHIPGSSHSHPAPGLLPVGIGEVARGRYMVSGTAGYTPEETETSLSHGLSRWAVRPSQPATSARLGSVGSTP